MIGDTPIGVLPIAGLPAAGGSGTALVQSGTKVTTTTRAASDTITIAASGAGNALFVWGCYNPSGGVTLAVTDDKSNTWTVDAVDNLNGTSTRSAFVASCLAPATGTTIITLTYSGGTAVVTAAWAEFSGITGLDHAAHHGSGGNGQTSPQTLTASAADTTTADLVLHAFTNGGSFSSNQAYTPPPTTSGGAYTNLVVQQTNNGTFANGYADYRINSAAITDDATDSWVTGADFIAQALVSYKGTASGGGNVTVALIGQAATFTTGSLAQATDKALTGQAVTSTAGSVSPSSTLALTGQAGTFTAGTLGVSSSVALTGQAATFTAGNVGAGGDVTLALTGQGATFTAGTLAPSLSVTSTGQAATFTAGSLAPSSSVTLAGAAATFTAGTISVSGDVTVALTGQSATFTAGTITVSGTVQPSQDAGSAAAAVVHIFQVTMNGQTREFGSYKAACDYIQQTKLAAQKAARKAVSRATQGKRTQIAEPKLTVNAPTLKPLADEMEAKIRQIYRQASIDMEIALHFAMQRESENDQIIMWMM